MCSKTVATLILLISYAGVLYLQDDPQGQVTNGYFCSQVFKCLHDVVCYKWL
jgi:hypothetical protein